MREAINSISNHIASSAPPLPWLQHVFCQVSMMQKFLIIVENLLVSYALILTDTENCLQMTSLTARFMGPTWGPSGARRTQVGPMLASWSLLSGIIDKCSEWNGELGHVVKARIESNQIFMQLMPGITICARQNSSFIFIRPFEKRTYYAMAMPVRLSVRPSVRPSVRVFRTFFQRALRYQFETWYMHSVGGTTCRVWVSSQLGHFDLVYSQK